MKQSKYNTSISIDAQKKMLFNTLHRNFIVYDNSKEENLFALLENLDRKDFGEEETADLKKLIHKKMIIGDNVDEVELVKKHEKRVRENEDIFQLVILPTLDCNFRCPYCYEEHRKLKIDDETANRIIKLVENITPNIKSLHITWFGGEPLLEADRVISLSKKIIEICEKNNCTYAAMIVSNGYLLNDELIDIIPEIGITRAQITVDGEPEFHNKKRPLDTGAGTFDEILKNVNKLIDKGLRITLRSNMDEENYDHIEGLYDFIPEDKRESVDVNICNLYQTVDKKSTYKIYKAAIDKGYKFLLDRNRYFTCATCLKNGLTIGPTGRLLACSQKTEETDEYFGHLGENGEPVIENRSFFDEVRNVSIQDNEACKECIKMPMCTSACKFRLLERKQSCIGKSLEWLEMEDFAKLQYFSDLSQKLIKGADII